MVRCREIIFLQRLVEEEEKEVPKQQGHMVSDQSFRCEASCDGRKRGTVHVDEEPTVTDQSFIFLVIEPKPNQLENWID